MIRGLICGLVTALVVGLVARSWAPASAAFAACVIGAWMDRRSRVPLWSVVLGSAIVALLALGGWWAFRHT